MFAGLQRFGHMSGWWNTGLSQLSFGITSALSAKRTYLLNYSNPDCCGSSERSWDQGEYVDLTTYTAQAGYDPYAYTVMFAVRLDSNSFLFGDGSNPPRFLIGANFYGLSNSAASQYSDNINFALDIQFDEYGYGTDYIIVSGGMDDYRQLGGYNESNSDPILFSDVADKWLLVVESCSSTEADFADFEPDYYDPTATKFIRRVLIDVESNQVISKLDYIGNDNYWRRVDLAEATPTTAGRYTFPDEFNVNLSTNTSDTTHSDFSGLWMSINYSVDPANLPVSPMEIIANAPNTIGSAPAFFNAMFTPGNPTLSYYGDGQPFAWGIMTPGGDHYVANSDGYSFVITGNYHNGNINEVTEWTTGESVLVDL